ncbi:tryptophan synthase, alpha chain [Cyclonatronum proteinivorum]|uniref:Tryptophan synthase alpha chain n=1 Tax=Cyclonatronum proteinivorum TaxID=1457365 RepID=A0A345UKW5_9BACT|nr:tryptophan synthase subunit alpha [Cyclonatronum proteinivorum]AXJ01117.1 tryptophan synthase, alpha chain [Cyclonatronum proteinivorum]
MESVNKTDQLVVSEGMKRVFENRKPGEKIMNLFITAGFPDKSATVDLILGYEKNGADIIELGMPFSDPLADGPTIQYSSEVALAGGLMMDDIFDMVKQVREKSEIPIVLMGYLNPLLYYGIEPFFERCAESGVDGLILPDVPVEESSLLAEESRKYQVPLIYLVAPNSTDERMRLVDSRSGGFVYCVSVTGVTGARSRGEVEESVNRFIERVNANITQNPVLVGFGISSHEDAMQISQKTDGFVVGSALINHIRGLQHEANWMEHHFEFVRSLKYGEVETA